MLRDMRDQLRAEAIVLYKAGMPWWITKSETQRDAERHQQDRYVGDPWDKSIADYVCTYTEVSIDEILRPSRGRRQRHYEQQNYKPA